MNFALFLTLTLLSAAQGRTAPPVVSTRLPEAVQLVAGESVEVPISVAVSEGYHLQANPASEDYLIPTRLELKTSGGVTVGKISYPPGKPYRLNGAEKDLQTYNGNFKITVLLKASGAAALGKRTLQGRLHYQACDSKTCLFPASVPLTITVKIVPATKH